MDEAIDLLKSKGIFLSCQKNVGADRRRPAAACFLTQRRGVTRGSAEEIKCLRFDLISYLSAFRCVTPRLCVKKKTGEAGL